MVTSSARLRRLALLVLVAGLMGACSEDGAGSSTNSDQAVDLVQQIIEEGKALPDEAEITDLCRFTDSSVNCRQIADNIVSDRPTGLSATIRCSREVRDGVVVEVSVNDEERTITPMFVTRESSQLVVRHPFYWSGIGLTFTDSSGAGSIEPDDTGHWC